MARSAVEIAKLLEELVVEAQASLQDHSKQVSQNDLELARIYHELELIDMNPFQSHVVMKHLQKVLRNRRAAKQERAKLQTLNEGLTRHNLLSKIGLTGVAVRKTARQQDVIVRNEGFLKQIMADYKAERNPMDDVFPAPVVEEEKVGVE